MRSTCVHRSAAGGPSRRDWLKRALAGVAGCSVSGWLAALAQDAANHPQRRRSCILLWMNGGPSQTDTFDLKPGHANGGPFREIETAVPGIKISEHLPRIAAFMKHMAIVRSMSSKETEHQQAAYFLHTGYHARGAVQYPSLGSLVAKEAGGDEDALPSYVSIAPVNPTILGSGFLGPTVAPLVIGAKNDREHRQPDEYEKLLTVEDLAPRPGVSRERFDARIERLQEMERTFVAQRPGVASKSHQTAYERAVKLMRTAAAKAFDLEEEPAKVRDAYGRNLFGQGCLLARRLVEKGVPFVEVALDHLGDAGMSWDTHQNNFETVKQLSQILDPAWAALMGDLQARGLLDSTLIVWMGEFGRTPVLSNGNGRDHWATGWSTVLAGGGIKGGQAIGKTSADGMEIKDREVSVPDLLATVCQALGIDPRKQNASNIGRPIRIVDPKAKPIRELL